jgi:nitrite reductase/ring-hydroxylating ferredoxin subunit
MAIDPAGWRDLIAADAVPEGRARMVEAAGYRLAVYRDGDRFHAIADRCPHAGGSMAGGWVEEGEAVCPLHRWRFRLDTGRCPDILGVWIPRFACEVREGRVWARLAGG